MEKRQRVFHVNCGIWQFNPNDYYAVLGVPVTADVSQIRKGYLNIAKVLHPDVYQGFEREQATQFLSKFVNPAYTLLIQEKERNEYSTILKLLAKQLIKKGEKIVTHSQAAKTLLQCPSNNFDTYRSSVEAIAKLQYSNLDQILEYSGQLSELNLVYVMIQQGYQPIQASSINFEDTVIQSQSLKSLPTFTTNSTTNSKISSQVAIIEEYIAKKQWLLAIRDLRAYLQVDNAHSRCHALLGFAYMHQKLNNMAKVSFQQALKLDPQEPLALQNISKVSDTDPVQSQTKSNSDKKKGFFGWLGGG
jgi:tetratricopeptide (TPR) repeat protein